MSEPAVAASVVIVGASLAGLSAVRALRENGFQGRITVVGDEKHRPYDRPPLSKTFLTADTDEPFLMTDDEDLGVDFRLGRSAVGITSGAEPAAHTVHLDDGGGVTADLAIIATGARARTLIGAEELSGVHTLRTLDDAIALRQSLDGARRLVVVGAGFIGAEVASTAAARGLQVTVVEASTAPLSGPLGRDMAEVVTAMHARHDVTLLVGASVETLQGAHGAVESVLLGDGTVLPADVVVIGIGAIPNTEWAAASGLAIDGGFVTDSHCSTTVPGIYAIGDCARSFDEVLQDHHRSEHWSNATGQAQVVARAIVGLPPAERSAAPYFWSDQYGTRLQFAGRRQSTDDVRIVDGDPATGPFVAIYERGDVTVAVLARDTPRLFTRLRKQLAH